MIKLTLREAMQVSGALVGFPSCAPKAGFNLGVIRNRLKSLLKPLGDMERALIIEHGGTIDPAGRITWPAPKDGEPTAESAYAKAWNDLLDKEEEIDREPVTLDDLLRDLPPEKRPALQPEILSMLEKIIVE